MTFVTGQKVKRTGGVMRDGQLGRVVTMPDGGLGVKLDRGKEDLTVPLHPNEWSAYERQHLAPMQLARVSYGADRELRMARGEYGVKDWMSLSERDRLAWMQAGPPTSDEERCVLYIAVNTAIKDA